MYFLTWIFSETDFSLVHFLSFSKGRFFPSLLLAGAVGLPRWLEGQTVNQQLALFLLPCSVKGTALNQLKRIPNWFQWAVHVEIWTLETLFLQPCKSWLFTSYLSSPRGARLKCCSCSSAWEQRHCRILRQGKSPSSGAVSEESLCLAIQVWTSFWDSLVETEMRLKH